MNASGGPHEAAEREGEAGGGGTGGRFEFGPQQGDKEKENGGLQAVDGKVRELGVGEQETEKHETAERTETEGVEAAPEQCGRAGEETCAQAAEQPEGELFAVGSGEDGAEGGQQSAERGGEGVRAFVRGEDEAVASMRLRLARRVMKSSSHAW